MSGKRAPNLPLHQSLINIHPVNSRLDAITETREGKTQGCVEMKRLESVQILPK